MENKINKTEFLNWYFGGSDQERQSTLISIALRIEEELYFGDANISIEDLIEESNIELFKEDTNGR